MTDSVDLCLPWRWANTPTHLTPTTNLDHLLIPHPLLQPEEFCWHTKHGLLFHVTYIFMRFDKGDLMALWYLMGKRCDECDLNMKMFADIKKMTYLKNPWRILSNCSPNIGKNPALKKFPINHVPSLYLIYRHNKLSLFNSFIFILLLTRTP